MKLLESKYYIQKSVLGLDEDENLSLLDKNQFRSSSHPFRKVLQTSLAHIDIEEGNWVIHQNQLVHFEQCTDFCSFGYALKKDLIYPLELCYFHKELEVFILLTSNLSNEYDAHYFKENLYKVEEIYYENTNPNALKNIEKLIQNHLEKHISQEAKVSILYKGRLGFSLKTHKITPYEIDFNTMYNDDFQEVNNHIRQGLKNKSKGIVLLHGIAGSGKTNYIKWLTAQIPQKKFIFIPTTMISSLTDPSFVELLVENPNSILVLEDCENYISQRSATHSNTDVVSSILNIADGILSDIIECQMICTFNTDISKIDKALLRKGRLIAEYKFKELSVEKSNDYLKSIGKEISVTQPTSLAELTNFDTIIPKENSHSTSIGFSK